MLIGYQKKIFETVLFNEKVVEGVVLFSIRDRQGSIVVRIAVFLEEKIKLVPSCQKVVIL